MEDRDARANDNSKECGCEVLDIAGGVTDVCPTLLGIEMEFPILRPSKQETIRRPIRILIPRL